MIKPYVYTVTLNPCIDVMLSLDALKVGGLNRIKEKRADCAGKGVNVAVVLGALGEAVTAGGMVFDADFTLYQQHLDAFNVSNDLINNDGSTRRNIKVRDLTSGEITEINESGGGITENVIGLLVDKLTALDKSVWAVVFSGSIPVGIESDIYYRLIKRLKHQPFVVLDAERERLIEGIKASPDMIKPNLYELITVTGQTPKSHEEMIKIARDFALPYGVKQIGLTLGADGAMMITKDESWYAPPLKVSVKSATGAGDSFVAGVLKAVHAGLPTSEQLKYGMAAASDSIVREGTELARLDGFNDKLKRVKTIKID